MAVNYYQLLGVKPPISIAELKSAYRKAAAIHHPDRGGKHQMMVLVNDAYAQVKWEVERGTQPKPQPEPNIRQQGDPRTPWTDTIDDLIEEQLFSGYKKAWVMFQLLEWEVKPPIEAWVYLAENLGYKKGWAWYKYNEWDEYLGGYGLLD